jgi:hypothetical protein
VRFFALALIALVSLPLAAQDKDLQEKKPAAKKSAAKKKPATVSHGARKKPTPEQIRKFKELERKQQQS